MTIAARTEPVRLLPALAARRSTRAFAPRPVDDELAASLLEAARWAPSTMNRQPWRFLVGHRGDQTYDTLLSTLMPGNRVWAGDAGMLIATLARTRPAEAGHEGDFTAAYELGLATAQLEAQAWSSGLVTHQMGGFDRDELRRAFAVPSEWLPVTVLAVGHPSDPAGLPEALAARELAPRERLPIAELLPTWHVAFDQPRGERAATPLE